MRKNVLMVTAIALFVTGIAVDRLWVRPVLARTRALESQRVTALKQVGSRAEAEVELDVLAEGLGLADLAQLTAAGDLQDPVVYIGRHVSGAGMRQIELTTDNAAVEDGLRRTRFTLRAHGSYAGCVDLVRALEGGSRLVTIEGLVIEPALVPGELECRIAMTIYDPAGKAAS